MKGILVTLIVVIFILIVVVFIMKYIIKKPRSNQDKVASNDDPFKNFPSKDHSIIVGNFTGDSIYVFFDPTKPFYKYGSNVPLNWWKLDGNSIECSNSSNKTYESCLAQQAVTLAWKNSDANFFTYDGKTWVTLQDVSSNTRLSEKNFPYRFLLKPKQFLIVQLPLYSDGKDSFPVTCSGLNNPESCHNAPSAPCGTDGCTGSGMWFTRTDTNLPTDASNIYRVPPATRMEFSCDIKSKNVYFNLSGVDGLNANLYVDYTGTKPCNKRLSYCDKGETLMKDCPFPENDPIVPKDWNFNTCLSPAKYSDLPTSQSSNPEVKAIYNDLSSAICGEAICAGCGTSDKTAMCECRKWWQKDDYALKWKSYVQSGNNCNIYSWAYDELIITDPNCTCPNCPSVPNKIFPLLNCPMDESGSIRIKVTKVL